ncbi:MAG TPA: ion channel [Rhizomicrobium sp.]|nr:ion channel [Rhizomicrobium sp.]
MTRVFTIVFLIVPLLSNTLVLVVSYLSIFDFAAHPERCYILTGVVAFASLVSLAAFPVSELPLGRAILGSILQAFLLLLIFACFYRDLGLVGAGPVTLPIGFYFSVVTWTTLGYGDLYPTDSMRLVAASGAMLGYVYSGILIGVLVTQFERARGS